VKRGSGHSVRNQTSVGYGFSRQPKRSWVWVRYKSSMPMVKSSSADLWDKYIERLPRPRAPDRQEGNGKSGSLWEEHGVGDDSARHDGIGRSARGRV